MEPHHQSEIIGAMKKPDFYPHPIQEISVRETHISTVFLTGNYVYKIKKPVDLEFLDFTTLDSRQHFCHEEVVLNRRLTRDVYLDVVSITLDDHHYALDGHGKPVEYAVKMRQLSDEFSILHLLRRNKLDGGSIQSLARMLAQFYKAAKTGPEIDVVGSWKTVWSNCEENFVQTQEFAGSVIDPRKFQIIQSVTRSFLRRRKSLFDQRLLEGKIRECHGDLRTGHIYFTPNGIQVIDCIEFNKRFRYQDVASDLAFLAMDLDFSEFPQTAHSLLKAYAHCSDDPAIFILMDFYKCYRAMVRVKVNCLRLQQGDLDFQGRSAALGETRRYLELAYRYAEQFVRPTLWIICGRVATGKSTLARELSEKLDISILRSDAVRKELFSHKTGRGDKTAFGMGIYSEEATSLTYGKLLLNAQEEIDKGCSVILDATFGTRDHRREALRLAENMDANIVFVECKCEDAVIMRRLEKREVKTAISDARPELFPALKQAYEAPDEIPHELYMAVDTEQPVESVMGEIFSHMDWPYI
jgi:aminoglycoside phosphotransferase family enzyme/predicted kinase